MSKEEIYLRSCILTCNYPQDLALLTQALLNLRNAENCSTKGTVPPAPSESHVPTMIHIRRD